MAWTYEATRKGYLNLWSQAKIRPERKATVLAKARKIATNQTRYQQLEAKTGVPWWWIAVAHNLEGGGDFGTYLGNGQSITKRTTIEPIGRGPFKTFEEGAIDAIKIKGFDKIKDWNMARALYHWEQFNGFGYVSKKINSPYVWSMTNLYTKGKYVADHVYDPNAVSQQIGAAAMMLGLMEVGAVKLEVGEEEMNEQLQASLFPFERIAPTVIGILAGPQAGLAVRIIADAIEEITGEDTPSKAEAVKDKVDTMPATKLGQVLKKAEEAIEVLLPTPTPVEPVIRADEPVTPPVSPVVNEPVVVQPVEPPASWWDKFIPAGWKTPIGIIVYCAGIILPILGVVTADIGVAIQTVGGGMIGIGIKSLIDRWLPMFAGLIKTRGTSVTVAPTAAK